MKVRDQTELKNKTGFKIEKKAKDLGIAMTILNSMLLQNSYVKNME